MHMFDLRQTLPKYLGTFLHENSVLIIGLTDQSGYSVCHLLVRLFINTVPEVERSGGGQREDMIKYCVT